MSVCVPDYLSVCRSVSVSFQVTTFELLKVVVSFLVHTYIFTISGSSLSAKVTGPRSSSN